MVLEEDVERIRISEDCFRIFLGDFGRKFLVGFW